MVTKIFTREMAFVFPSKDWKKVSKALDKAKIFRQKDWNNRSYTTGCAITLARDFSLERGSANSVKDKEKITSMEDFLQRLRNTKKLTRSTKTYQITDFYAMKVDKELGWVLIRDSFIPISEVMLTHASRLNSLETFIPENLQKYYRCYVDTLGIIHIGCQTVDRRVLSNFYNDMIS